MRWSMSFWAAIVLVLSLPVWVAGQTVIPVDDFNDGNDDGWSPLDTTDGKPFGPGTFDASSGSYLLQGGGPSPPDDPADGLLVSEWDMSADPLFSNGYLRFKVKVNEKNTSAFVAMREDLSTFSSDVFAVNTELDNFRFLIQQVENFVLLPPVIVEGPPYEPNIEWMMEAGAVGSQLSLKYWKVGDPEPALPQVTAPDVRGATGRFSVAVSFPGNHNPASLISATFDDIVFIVPEPAAITLGMTGLLLLLATGRRRGG